jgi:hypothetical protein
MNRWQWWVGVVVVSASLFLHALFPRFEIRPVDGFSIVMRIDRWRGTVEVSSVLPDELNSTDWGKRIEARPWEKTRP